MPRAPRDFYAGGYYHVTTRGNNKGRVYVDPTDRYVFLVMLELVTDFYGKSQTHSFSAYREFVEAGMAYDDARPVPGTDTAA